MSVRKILPWQGLVRRYVVVNAFIFALANPTPLSLIGILRHDMVPGGLKLLLAAAWTAIMVALVRQAICGFRSLGRVPLACLALAFGLMIYAILDQILSNPSLLRSFVQVAGGAVLTLGNVAAYYVRQVSGQSPVLKTPP